MTKDKYIDLVKLASDEYYKKYKEAKEKKHHKEFYENGWGISVSPSYYNLELFEIIILKGIPEKYKPLHDTQQDYLTEFEVELIKERIKNRKIHRGT